MANTQIKPAKQVGRSVLMRPKQGGRQPDGGEDSYFPSARALMGSKGQSQQRLEDKLSGQETADAKTLWRT